MKPQQGKRRGWIALMILALVASLAAGCGSKADNGGGSGGNAAGNEKKTEQNGEQPKTVEITVWDKPAPDSPLRAVKEEIFAAFDAAYPHIKVIHADETQTREKFMAAVAGGEQPTVFRPSYPDAPTYIQSGIVADITDLFDDHPEKGNFNEGALSVVTKDGRIYGVPNDMYATGLYYNKKLFANAGIAEPPKTWDEFVETAKKVMAANPGTIGFDILGMDWADWHFEYYVWQAGGDLTERQPDGTVKLMFASEPAVTALQFYKDLKWTHKIVQSNVLQSYDENSKDFYTGKTAMILGASDQFYGFVANGMNPEDIGFAPYPVGPAGVGPAQTGGSFWAISPTATPEQREAAFEYIMFMMSKDVVEQTLQFQVDNGLGVNPLTVRTDVDMTKYAGSMPADVIDAINKASENVQLEYFLKGQLTPYVVKAIQKVLLDENADPRAELEAAQELAQKEVADRYNQEVLSGNTQ